MKRSRKERLISSFSLRAKALWVCSMAHTSADAESEPEGRLCVWRSTVRHRTTRRVAVRTVSLPIGAGRVGQEHDAQPSSVLPTWSGFTRHPLTVKGAAQMISLVERARPFRELPLS